MRLPSCVLSSSASSFLLILTLVFLILFLLVCWAGTHAPACTRTHLHAHAHFFLFRFCVNNFFIRLFMWLLVVSLALSPLLLFDAHLTTECECEWAWMSVCVWGGI